MYRHRIHTIPKLPKTRAEVDIAAPWRETHDGERFLLFADSEEDKMLVFATDDQLRVLQSASIVYMDGTFSACPDLWNQLYILHARKRSITYPLVYALMPDRRTTTYQRFFAQLKVHIQQLLNQPFNPETFQVDFEVAAIRALRTEFQGSDIKGCFFHFTQAIWRKTQELGLAVGYRDNPLVFIEIIKQIEKSEKTKLSQLDLGVAPPARKRVYKEIHNRLSRMKDQLSQGVKTPLQFLDAVGKLLKMD
ncbi:uncharacterized protein [Haliotis cracherodii]|uniref:uncharacterized protein n=1 Tax=Haliotis cracherodii TaxID=6455 RepID=UPI0039EC5949